MESNDRMICDLEGEMLIFKATWLWTYQGYTCHTMSYNPYILQQKNPSITIFWMFSRNPIIWALENRLHDILKLRNWLLSNNFVIFTFWTSMPALCNVITTTVTPDQLSLGYTDFSINNFCLINDVKKQRLYVFFEICNTFTFQKEACGVTTSREVWHFGEIHLFAVWVRVSWEEW